MTSPQFYKFLTPLLPYVTPVMPWKSSQIAIFCTPFLPLDDVILDNPLGESQMIKFSKYVSILNCEFKDFETFTAFLFVQKGKFLWIKSYQKCSLMKFSQYLWYPVG